MGASLWQCNAAARSIFEEADRATGLPLRQVCAEGPADRLTGTDFAQPGVVAVSLAAAYALQERMAQSGLEVIPSCCAGHSVGELAALVFSGAVTVSDGLRLVAARGRLMAEASALVDGSMSAVLGLDEAPLLDVCAKASEVTGVSVQVANLNAPGQVVLSGHRAALARAAELAREAGARRVVDLDVSGPFHSIYMQPAADDFREIVASTAVKPPLVPMVLNVTAEPSDGAEGIKRELVVQVTSPVRWADSVRTMADMGCTVFVELGPGQVLSGLIKRIVKDAVLLNVEDEESLHRTADKLAELLQLRR